MCGAPAAQGAAPTEEPHDRETVRFLRAVIRRPATFTFIFLIANVFIYLLMTFSGGATGRVLLAYGAKLNYLIDHGGQWWRFVTPIFLHVYVPGLGPLHLLANMYGLFMLGPYVEKLYGSARFVVIWIVTGVAGVVASYLTVRPDLADEGWLGRFLFKAHDVQSAGASGALFGLIGVLFVFGIKFRHELPEGLKRAFGAGMLPTIVINLFIGFVGSGFIDNAAHLGGLVSGMLLGALVSYKRVGPRGPIAYTWHFMQLACLALVVAGFVMVARNFDATVSTAAADLGRTVRLAPPGGEAVEQLRDAVNESNGALVAFFGGGDGSRLAGALKKMEQAPALDAGADRLRDDLRTLVARGRDLAADTSLAPPERRARIQQLADDHAAWQERFQRWAETDGRDYGITLREEKQ